MNDGPARLKRVIADANAGALFPDLSGLVVSDLDDPRIVQITAFGSENHRLKTWQSS